MFARALPMMLVIVLLLTVSLAEQRLCLAHQQQTADDPFAKLKGVWIKERVLSAGKEVPDDKFPFELHFENENLTFKFVGAVQGKDRVHEVKLDTSKEPLQIDLTRTGRGKQPTILGIYKFDGDRLLICSLRDANGQPSNQRPTSFESSETVRSELLVLKRKPVDVN